MTAAIIFNILGLVFALQWIKAPFPGTLLYANLVVADTYNPDWSARQQGIRSGDALLAVDDVPVTSGRDLYLLLQEQAVGETAALSIEPYLAQAAPPETQLSVTLTDFSLQDMLIFFWLPYIIGLIYLSLGLVIFRLRQIGRASNIFITFCAFVSIVAGGIFDHYTLHFLTPIWLFVLPLSGAALIHLGLEFPITSRLMRHQLWLRFVPYVVALALGMANLYSLYFAANSRLYLTIRLWDFGFIGLAYLLFLGLQLHTRLFTLSSMVRQQTSIIFWSSIIAFGPAGLWLITNAVGWRTPFVWPIFAGVFIPVTVFPLAITYAMLRYRILDIDTVFNRGMVYTLLTLLVTVVYFIIVSFLGALFQGSLFQDPIVLAIFVVVLVIALDPLKQRIQTAVNRLFLRETFDYRQILQSYGRSLISAPLSSHHILELLVQQANQTLVPERSVVFLRDLTLGAFIVSYPRNDDTLQTVDIRFGLSDDLAQWLADTNNILQISPGGAAPDDVSISTEELARLNMLNIALCVPLLGSENLLGWLALGLKRSGQPYTSDDLLFLATLASQTIIALENAQLLEEANRRAAELEALQTISANIQAEADADALLASVVEQATNLLHAEGGLVYLLQPNQKTLKAVVSYNLDKDYTDFTVDSAYGIAGRVLTLGKPVVIDNYHAFSGRLQEFGNSNFGAVLGVPLRWGGKVRGVLCLMHKPHGLRFREDDIWLMKLFATQAAIALEKSQLLNEAQKKAHQLTTLGEVSLAISSTLDLDTVLIRIMQHAIQLLNAEAGSLLLMDSLGKTLRFEVVLGPSGDKLLGLTTPVGKGIVGTVAKSGEPLIINDVTSDPRWNVNFDEETEFKTKDLMCVPMMARNEVIGVIEVLNKQDGSVFTDEDCALLMSFGGQAAIAIQNAQKFTSTDQALNERMQELQTLQMFDQQLQTSIELQTVLDTTLTYAMDALGLSIGAMGVVMQNKDNEAGLYLLVQRGMPMELSRYKNKPWPLSQGFIGHTVRTGQASLVNDVTEVEACRPAAYLARSVVVVPVKQEGKVIGVINLESTSTDYFTEEDLNFVNILVSHAAIAIDNAQLFEQVKQANQSKTEFMSTASHELKIPMTSIKGYAKLLQMGAGGPLSDRQKDFLEVISNNVDRMDRLVSDLLDVSRIEAGRIRLEIGDVQIRDVIDDVVESVQNQVKAKKLNLTLRVEENLPEIRADYNRMVQIMTNLVSNAYKYTPEGGDITVIAQPYFNGDVSGLIQGIKVTVKDTGYGINQEDLANLFTNFFRSNDQNIRNEPGTGLGLSITKKMIENHGGELTVESEYGKGSAFTFIAPLVSKIPPGVEVIER
ncbi:MAG: GAF domain-containing protein [Anaerolineae bacterium]|nr:GAF domain-containing protein [Anaerolineae bacterium]MCB9105166.1 GAF domain-containing protein [Anaerolineales bacterium]